MTLIILIILSALSAYVVLTYQRLLTQIDTIHHHQTLIDMQLDRRYKLFSSLMNAVKKHVEDERTTLRDVVVLRAQAQQAKENGDRKTRMGAENQISDIAMHLNVIFEQHPVLKTDAHCLQYQAEIASTENKLAYAKQSYNDSIDMYNANKQSFPASLLVTIFRQQLDCNSACWQASELKIAEQAAYTVQL